MKLIYRVTKRLSVVLLPILAIWAIVFYYSMAVAGREQRQQQHIQH